MIKKYKKYLIFLAILAVLSPLGIILPKYFNAGDAWGEWSLETVKEQTGYEPEGMKKDANIYEAPVADYHPGKESDSLPRKSVGYILSGILGTVIILSLTFGISKLVKRKAKE
jgi:hypothetical protein